MRSRTALNVPKMFMKSKIKERYSVGRVKKKAATGVFIMDKSYNLVFI